MLWTTSLSTHECIVVKKINSNTCTYTNIYTVVQTLLHLSWKRYWNSLTTFDHTHRNVLSKKHRQCQRTVFKFSSRPWVGFHENIFTPVLVMKTDNNSNRRLGCLGTWKGLKNTRKKGCVHKQSTESKNYC